MPVLGPIRQKIILARFSTVFAMLYRAGISVLECIQICEKIVGNRVMEEGLQRVGRSISEGQGISQAFLATKLFPPLVLRMLRVGESTGGLDTALLNVSYFYNRQVREGIDRMQQLLGPRPRSCWAADHRDPVRDLPADLRRHLEDQVLGTMANRYLYLTNTRLVSLELARGQVREAREFEVSEGRGGFDAYLAGVRPCRPASSPISGGRFPPRHDSARRPERPRGHRRAQARADFPQYAVPARARSGPRAEGRRDDRVVYAAITNPRC
jgi:hypothetical protein